MFGLKKRTWIIGGVVAALLGTAAFATAKYHNMTPEERAAMATDRISERLDLDETQRSAFENVAATYMDLRGTTPEFMIDLSEKLSALARDETLTVEEVNILREEIKAEFDRRADVLIPEFVAFYNTLDESQREMVAARMDRFGERVAKGDGWHHRHHARYHRGEGYEHRGRHMGDDDYGHRGRYMQDDSADETPEATE